MNWRSGAVDLALCALLSLEISARAYGQNAETPKAQNASSVESQNDQKAEDALRTGYRKFIFLQGSDEENYRAAVEAGRKPLIPRCSYAKSAHTSEGEEETIHAIIFAAYESLVANDAQHESDNHELQRQGYSTENLAKMDGLYKAHAEKEKAIVEQTIAQLKGTLTEEDFQRLDLLVHLLERIGK